jgi:very-short-patch-repair endonuclease
MQPGLLTTRLLRAHGLRTRDIRRAVAAGDLTRPRRGWYATSGTPAPVVTAARVGGRLTCLDALGFLGAWTLDVPGVHVRVSDGVAVVRLPGVHIHWTSERVEPGIDSVEEALATAVGCVDFRAVVIVADSLVNRGLITPVRLQAVLGLTPRGRRVLGVHDPSAESGIETYVRLALRRHRVRVRSQVAIPGVGRVDLLVGERLVIEADGYDWHGDRAAFERDRERDRELVRRGYVVIRVSYRQVLGDLDAVMVAVLDVVRRREHRWRAVHRAQLWESGYLIDLSTTFVAGPES